MGSDEFANYLGPGLDYLGLVQTLFQPKVAASGSAITQPLFPNDLIALLARAGRAIRR